MRKESRKTIALLALFFIPLVVWGQKNIPLVLENESVRQSGPRVPHSISGISTIPTPTATLYDAMLIFTLPEATTFGILIQSQPSTDTVYSGAKTFSSSAEHSIDISEACSAPGKYLIRLYAFGVWWRGEFAVEKEKTPVPKDYITLVNDDSVVADYDELRARLDNDIIYIAFSGHGCMPVTITGKDSKTFFDKELVGATFHDIQLNYLGMPNGEYTLNIFWNGCWWRGDFVFKSHWPEGEYVWEICRYHRPSLFRQARHAKEGLGLV